MLIITPTLKIPDDEIDLQAVRSQGAGGQNVNKVSTAVQLRFDIMASSLPEAFKIRLRQLADRRITKEGVLVIKAQLYRSQEQNRQDALRRLQELLQQAAVVLPHRHATKPSRAARQKRLQGKAQRARLKAWRAKVTDDHE